MLSACVFNLECFFWLLLAANFTGPKVYTAQNTSHSHKDETFLIMAVKPSPIYLYFAKKKIDFCSFISTLLQGNQTTMDVYAVKHLIILLLHMKYKC